MQGKIHLLWLILIAAGSAAIPTAGKAQGALVTHFEHAKQFDPLFQAAHAERNANLVSSNLARTALLPQLQINSSRLETESSQRTTATVVQPLVDANRFATYQEGEPREIIANATFQAREQDLALRYFKAVSEVVRNRESLSLNKAQIESFDQQARSAKRAFELGTGTVTDLRDAQVRLDQARATDIRLRALLLAAERQFYAMTGRLPPDQAFSLARRPLQVALGKPEESLSRAAQNNPQLVASRQNERIADLAITRAKGAFLPTVNVTATRTHSSRFSDSYVGVQISIPLQASTFLQVSAANANAAQASYQTDALAQRTQLEVQRLRDLVEAGRSEIAFRLQSIESAELSVEANEKSFRGGVRSKLDVINSIQILYQVKQEHLEAVLALADHFLQLNMQLAMPVFDSLEQVENLLFETQTTLLGQK